MRNCILFSLLLLLGFSTVNAQVSLQRYGRYDSVAVHHGADSLLFPWVGGMNNPQFSAMNLNGDTLMDLVFFDRSGSCIRPFINSGEKNFRAYRYAPEYEAGFPKMWDYTLMRDYNHDGKEDIFTSYNGDFRVFLNTSPSFDSDSLSFSLQRFKAPWDTAQTEQYLTCRYYASPPNYIYTNVFNSAIDMPGIVDVDRDGDLDILAFGNGAGSIYWYENKGADQGLPDELHMELTELCWGRFQESAIDFSLLLGSCKGKGPGNNGGGTRHSGGSSIYMKDMNCNGLTDLVLGDNDYTNMIAGFNTGMHSSAQLNAQDTTFPVTNIPVELVTFPAAYGLDADNDQREDFIVSPNATENYRDKDQVQLYVNRGLDSCIRLARQIDPFLSPDLIDLGTDAHPVFFDLDKDGLVDIICGSMGYYDPQLSTFKSTLTYYKNVGSLQQAKYSLISSDLLGANTPTDTGFYPTFADMDNDGDQDLLMASFRGANYYFENQAATPQDSAIFVFKNTSFDQLNLGKNAHPFLFDVNADGRTDLIVGSQAADLKYYQNIGTSTQAHFSATVVQDTFGGISIPGEIGEGNLTAWIGDMDTSGKSVDTLDELASQRLLFVGTADGMIFLYDRFDSTAGAAFRPIDSLYVYTRNVSLTLHDINDDDKPDILYGHRTGGLSVLLKDGGNTVPQPEDTTVSVQNWEAPKSEIGLYPNPGKGLINLKNPNEWPIIRVEIWNSSGQLIQVEEHLSEPEVQMNVQEPGLYIVRIVSDQGIFTSRYILSP